MAKTTVLLQTIFELFFFLCSPCCAPKGALCLSPLNLMAISLSCTRNTTTSECWFWSGAFEVRGSFVFLRLQLLNQVQWQPRLESRYNCHKWALLSCSPIQLYININLINYCGKRSAKWSVFYQNTLILYNCKALLTRSVRSNVGQKSALFKGLNVNILQEKNACF